MVEVVSATQLEPLSRSLPFAFAARLDSYNGAFLGHMALHPRLQQKIRVIDLVFFMAEHDDQHLARISELKRQFA